MPARQAFLAIGLGCAWLVSATSGCGGQSNAQGGLANAPSINRPASESVGHDVISNGAEACGPTPANPEGSKLPQCVETASPIGSSRGPVKPAPRK